MLKLLAALETEREPFETCLRRGAATRLLRTFLAAPTMRPEEHEIPGSLYEVSKHFLHVLHACSFPTEERMRVSNAHVAENIVKKTRKASPFSLDGGLLNS